MTERARYWAKLVAAWRRSGLSQADFCRRRDIQVGAFRWWKRQLGKPSGDIRKRHGRAPQTAHRFVEVRLKGTPVVPAYEIILHHGRVLRLPDSFDPTVVARLITAVESC